MSENNYAVLLLTAKYQELLLKRKHARIEMSEYPNQYTDDLLTQIEPMINDLHSALIKLKEGGEG